MERVFEREDSEEVIELTREFIPRAMAAAATITALTGDQPDHQSRQVIELAGRMSRDMAKTYLEEVAIRRSVCPDVPPYGCRCSVDCNSERRLNADNKLE